MSHGHRVICPSPAWTGRCVAIMDDSGPGGSRPRQFVLARAFECSDSVDPGCSELDRSVQVLRNQSQHPGSGRPGDEWARAPAVFPVRIGRSPTDVYPWDICIAPANNLNWKPRFVCLPVVRGLYAESSTGNPRRVTGEEMLPSSSSSPIGRLTTNTRVSSTPER